MDNVTLNRFKELLSVPSKTYQEDQMVEYISWVLDSMEGVEYYTDEMNNIYATKRQDGFNGYFPMFVAHTDTVHSLVDEIVVKELDITFAGPVTASLLRDKKPYFYI